MKEILIRMMVIICGGIALLAYVFPWTNYWLNAPFWDTPYKLWLDLQWWVELDYKVDLEEAKLEEGYSPEKEAQILEWLKSIIDKRVESLKINDSVITSANYWWEQHIIVQIPLKWQNPEEDKLNVARAKKAIWKVTKIMFKELRTETTEEDIAERTVIADKALAELKKSEFNFSVTAAKIQDTYADVETWELSVNAERIKDYFALEEWGLKEGRIMKLLDGTWVWSLTGVDGKWLIDIKKVVTNGADTLVDLEYIFISWSPSRWVPAKDSKWRVLNDKYFTQAAPQTNEAFQPHVELTFNSEWAKIFGELSERLVGKQMAIFVWWELLTDPVINEPIRSWRAIVTWNYTFEQASTLSNDINTWVVPAPIYLTSEKSIDSKLWANSLQQLIVAWGTGFLLIFIFLIWTYRLSGLFASVALLLYVVIILSLVKVLWVTLTLASVAWLILSIGMAIDANILIFERIRDEINKWESSLVKASKVWFRKSWTAIWDSNVTGLIVALILFIFGINLIKWFGLMLAIWIVVSLFSVMRISRVLVFVGAKSSKKGKNFIGLSK